MISAAPGARSAELMERSARVLPGGVNSPVRAFGAVGGTPPVFRSAEGARLYDEDSREYVDFVLAYGPHLLGHRPPAVDRALREQLQRGLAFGGPTALELGLAERVVDAVASVEMVRFVNSGTEATMSALRLARAVTGRDGIVKFAGGYHGHSDQLLAAAGSGVATLGIPGSAGVARASVADTVVVAYNDAAAIERVFEDLPVGIAAVIVEPVAGNMGCVPPAAGWLELLRRLTSEHGAMLIFDEVMTGFRIARGGAQQLYGVAPDLTCLGKVIGGGLPVGAYGGSACVMSRMAPAGDVYQAGTLSGSPLAMAAGCAVLDALDDHVYERLEHLGGRLEAGLRVAAAEAGVACAVQRVGSMITPFIGVEAVPDFASALRCDTGRFGAVHRAWLEAGIFWPPSQFETAFLSTAHTDQDVDHAVAVFSTALRGSGGG